MGALRRALERQRELEQEFVAEAQRSEKAPKGWPAALVMFHVGMWRERLRDGLAAAAEGREHTPPAQSEIDPINDRELPSGIGTPLADAAARADRLLVEIIDLYERLGDRPFTWTNTANTTEAVLRNSFTHPRVHMFDYYRENGVSDRGAALWAEAVGLMRAAQAPPVVLGAALCNLGAVRAAEGKVEEAIELLAEGFPMRPDIRANAADDDDLRSLRGNPRFEELLKS